MGQNIVNRQTPCFRVSEEVFHDEIGKIQALFGQAYKLTFVLEITSFDIAPELVFIDFFESFSESFFKLGLVYSSRRPELEERVFFHLVL